MKGVQPDVIMGDMKTQASDNEGMLSASLHQRFGGFKLAVDFQVPLGLIVLFGPSGAGKSLTLRSLAGLLHPEQGFLAINGHLLLDSEQGIDLPPQERRVGYVPQHYALFPHLTVAENIRFALPRPKHILQSRREKAAEAQHERVAQLVAALELEGLERRYPATLSGGQQQRVALARALAAEPRLLLLDEPFNALDAPVRERLRETLKRFQRRFAVPIVLVTHDHVEAQQLADTILVIQHGQIVQAGTVQDIFLSPRTPGVARLVGQHNIFAGSLSSPPEHQPDAPSMALRLHWLHSLNTQAQLPTPASKAAVNGWLPLPASVSSSPSSSAVLSSISGCIRSDEVLVHRWPGGDMRMAWTKRGAVQWKVTLLDAQLYGPTMRLLVRPAWEASASIETTERDGTLEIFLSRWQWREIEVSIGQPLLLEIGPEAVHCFERI